MFSKTGFVKLTLLGFAALLFVAVQAAAGDSIQKKDEELQKKEITLVKEYWHTPVKSQGSTGTCWSFSSTSFIESEVYRLGKGEFELSEMFNVRNCYVEKAERYIRMHGKNNFGPGGLFHDVLWVLKNYGAVRDSDFSGLGPDEKKYNHREFHSVLAGYLDGVLKARKPSAKWLKGFEAILDAYLDAEAVRCGRPGH